MSYDLHIFRASEGQDPLATIQEIFEREESENEISPEVPTLFIDALKKVHANYEWSADSEPDGELLREEFGLLISATPNYIEISMAYWHSGNEADSAMNFLGAVVDEIIQSDPSTLWGYDPQEDNVFKSLSTSSAVDQMERGNQILHQVVDKGEPKRPWWKFW